jgi:hypothetical protein
MEIVPHFIPHNSPQMTAGAVLDDPEEGDRVEINGAPYEYMGIAMEQGGELVEVFGWWQLSYLYPHPHATLSKPWDL